MNSTPEQRRFASIPAHSVRAGFAGGGLSSDLGPILLRGVDLQIGLTKRLAAALPDRRHQSYVILASVSNAFRLFVQKAGMRLIAAAGKVHIQAQSDDVTAIANKVLELISESDWVDIRGKKGVRLHGANGMLEVSDKTQFFTPSPVLFYGNLETLTPKSVSQAVNERSSSRFDQEVRLLQVNNKPAPNIAYELIHEDGHLIDGKTVASGSTNLQKGTGLDSYTIRYKGELP